MRPRRVAILGALALAAALSASARGDAEQDRWVEWHALRALRLQAEGRAKEATEEFRAAAVLAPDDARAAARAAVALVEFVCDPPATPSEKDPAFQSAEALVREAIRRGGLHDPALAYAIGRLKFAVGQHEVAEQMLGIARRRGFDPLRARLWHYRAMIADFKRLHDLGNFDEGVRRMELVVSDFPDHPDVLAARIDLAIAWRMRNERLLAEKELLRATKDAPWAALAYLVLGQVYADESRWADAETAFRTAMDRAQEKDDGVYTGPQVHADALLNLATMERRRGELDRSERLSRQYLTLRPDDPDGLFALANALKRRAEEGAGAETLDEAKRHFRRAIRLAPDRPEFLMRLAELLTFAGETQEAEELQRRHDALREKERVESDRRTLGEPPKSPEPGKSGAPGPGERP